MRFAHMADIHLGCWREPKLRELCMKAFEKAIGICVDTKVDFALISGDVFNTSLPPLEIVKRAVTAINRMRKAGIPIYVIAGSHDFSASGRSMLEVLEEAGLFVNVCRGTVEDGKLKLVFTVDGKTGAKITGMIGKKGMLDRKYYEQLTRSNLEEEEGFKIFMFHTAISELKPKELEKMESAPVSLLPTGFDYYAGGHVHIVADSQIAGYKRVVFPGPLFPTSFSELEKLECGGMYVFDKGSVSYQPVRVCNVLSIQLDGHHTALSIKERIVEKIQGKELNNTLVTIRVLGKLDSGRLVDIEWKEIYDVLYDKSAIFVMRNTNGLQSEMFDEIKVASSTTEEIEDRVIAENSGQIDIGLSREEEARVVRVLLQKGMTREDGEKVTDYEKRVVEEIENVLEVMQKR